MRIHLLVINIINAVVFIFLLSIFNSIFDFDQILVTANNELVLIDVITAIKDIFTYLIYFFSYMIGVLCGSISSGIFSPIPYYNSGFMYNFLGFFFKNFISKGLFPKGQEPSPEQVPGLIGDQMLIFTTDIYLLMFQILFLVCIIFYIRAIFQNDPKHNLVVVGSLVLMIVIPLVIFGFRNMLNIFLVEIEYLEELQNPIDPALTALPIDDAYAFFTSRVALLAIVCYIYLELAFQINYVDIVTKPSLERGERLEGQLKILKKESLSITANVDKIKEEAKEKIKELQLEEEENVRGLFAQTGEKFSYIKEMIKKKKLEDEEKKLITAASKTRRLGRYLERLFREDPEAQDTLTAKSSAPKPKSLITSTITTFTFRVTLLIILSYIIIHPRWFLIYIFQLPPAITESIVMYSPEIIIILLGPFILLFPVIAWMISYVKHRNLIIRLKQEGRIKEILASVGDYVVKEEKEEEEEVEEGASEVATVEA